MASLLIVMIVLGVFTVVCLILMLPTAYDNPSHHRAYLERIGDTLGFESAIQTDETAHLIGRRDGFGVAIYTEPRGGEYDRKIFVAIDVELPKSIPEGLVIAPEGVLDGIVSKIGMREDIEIAHDAFDDAFVVQGGDEQRLRRLFRKGDIADELVRLQASYPKYFCIRDGELHVELPGTPPASEIEECLGDMIAWADQIRRNAPGPSKPEDTSSPVSGASNSAGAW